MPSSLREPALPLSARRLSLLLSLLCTELSQRCSDASGCRVGCLTPPFVVLFLHRSSGFELSCLLRVCSDSAGNVTSEFGDGGGGGDGGGRSGANEVGGGGERVEGGAVSARAFVGGRATTSRVVGLRRRGGTGTALSGMRWCEGGRTTSRKGEGLLGLRVVLGSAATRGRRRRGRWAKSR